ncbi:hypothetical protein ScalyP_jg4569, partial [Parmales sp. scaly parma]
APYSQLPVTFSFRPTLPPPPTKTTAAAMAATPGSRNFAARVTVEGAGGAGSSAGGGGGGGGTGGELSVLCEGRAVRPEVELSQKVLRFGECPVYERRDILLSVK